MFRTLLLLFACTPVLLAGEGKRPNLVFIFSDDHALNAISAYGGPLAGVAPTPNLDRLADQGAIFSNSFCGNSICGPSRASILTGLHSHANGFLDNDFSTFDGNQRTVAKLLQSSGYETAIIGKWHLVSQPQGFDHWEILPGQGHYYNPDFITPAGSKREEGYVTDLITDKAIRWLDGRANKEKPFLLMCQHKAPHRNWSPALRHTRLFSDTTIPEPESLFDDYSNRSPALAKQAMTIARHMDWQHDMKFEGENLFPNHFTGNYQNAERARMNDEQRAAWDAAYRPENEALIADIKAGRLDDKAVTRWKYQRYLKDYLRCVRAVDENVGRLLDHLDQTGLAENTIVIYSSDQGFYLGEHGWYDKRWMFEESLKMPFLIRWPGVVKPGSRPEAMIQNIDYAPTFLEMAGAPVPTDLHGRSLVPVLKDATRVPKDWRESIYYFYSGENTHNVAAHDGVRTSRYKLIWFPRTKEWNLFDLRNDPQEMNSVHEDPAYATILGEMKDLYQKTRATYGVNDATVPDQRLKEDWWKTRHREKRNELAAGGHDLVFIGDSITQGWEEAGRDVWNKAFGARKALNLGFSGDRTEHVLWRLFNGGFEGAKPRVLVLMIGTNNTGHKQQDPGETAAGVAAITRIIRDRSPETSILLLGVLPRGEGPQDPLRKINEDLNRKLTQLADGKHIRFFDGGSAFLAPDGTCRPDLMPDKLHLSPEGYKIWAAQLSPIINTLGGWDMPAP